ncbi:MAG TPA: PhoH family protein [Bacteroidia bacterium]|nr:PhoH family protein [Sphingobacteriales bacterium]HPD64998.1 PhoH family protein [Bacteroidia bacterium]HRS58128.1 PhoH family protein [Bacteroidia bacterium]HRU68761.1 PhoH family protein [Bacteroidia bacterium]
MAKKKKSYKIFVLDTNVVLHDFQSIYSFQDNIVVIPITLLEEVDKFKRGNEIINFNAREFIRELDKLFTEGISSDGVELPDGGRLIISTDTVMEESLRKVFLEDKPDHRILSVANNLSKKEKEHTVILVSKDINLRMKAKSIGLNAQDYETGKVKDIDELYRGKNLIEHVPSEIIDKIYKDGFITVEESGLHIECYPNEYFIVRNGVKSILTVYHKESNSLRLVEKVRAYGITPRNAEQAFALNALMNPAISLVTLAGKAGTGKTLMALAAALEVRKDYKQILLARPIIPLSNRDLGFLPGDIKTKLDPYMQPLIDNLTVIKHQFKEESQEFARINDMMKNEKLVITPLAYIRGRSLSKVYFIVDEAQNLTPHEVKTIITRAGEGTKVVFTGDPYQIDTPYLDSRSNGLTTLIDRMKGQELYAHITMEKGERSILAELASNIL